MKELRVPEERVSVLIGSGGETIEEIESLVAVELTVDGNVVRIDGDPLEELRAFNIAKAIGRGFAPEKALRLLEDNAQLAVLDVTDFVDTDSGKERLKGRVIGHDGEAKAKIENDTETEIAVYGKTIGIIGQATNVEVARSVVQMLLEGRSHATAYQYLEKQRDKLV